MQSNSKVDTAMGGTEFLHPAHVDISIISLVASLLSIRLLYYYCFKYMRILNLYKREMLYKF